MSNPPPPESRLLRRFVVIVVLVWATAVLPVPWAWMTSLAVGWLGPRMLRKTWVEAVEGCDELWHQALDRHQAEQIRLQQHAHLN